MDTLVRSLQPGRSDAFLLPDGHYYTVTLTWCVQHRISLPAAHVG
jgi:hypothetical protein